MEKTHTSRSAACAASEDTITPEEFYYMLKGLYNDFLNEFPEDEKDAEYLNRYAEETGLDKTSPLVMMFIAYCGGLVKGMEVMGKLLDGKGKDNA